MRPGYIPGELVNYTEAWEHTHLSQYHECHAEPPPCVLQVAVAHAGLFVVLFVRLQQAMLLNHKRGADEQTR
jgi:hypothetical protein